MEKVESFITNLLKGGNVPRVRDVYDYVKREKLGIKKNKIDQLIRLNPVYTANVHQERDKKRFGKQRPIISNVLGNLHADIGYYPVVRAHPTPKLFQHGFFVAKDILSRFIYVELMNGPKSADNLIKVLKRLFIQHKKYHPDYNIISISFDKEKAMMGHKVRAFLKSKQVQFFYFEMSATKASVAENGIRLLRTDVERILKSDLTGLKRWWKELKTAAKSLNNKLIYFKNKSTGFTPNTINSKNANEFLENLQKLVPGNYFSQFSMPTGMGKYKFPIGSIVRPKLITSSTALIGQKTSIVNLDTTRLKILDQYPFITTNLYLKNCYKCLNIETGEIDIFTEEDLALSV